MTGQTIPGPAFFSVFANAADGEAVGGEATSKQAASTKELQPRVAAREAAAGEERRSDSLYALLAQYCRHDRNFLSVSLRLLKLPAWCGPDEQR